MSLQYHLVWSRRCEPSNLGSWPPSKSSPNYQLSIFLHQCDIHQIDSGILHWFYPVTEVYWWYWFSRIKLVECFILDAKAQFLSHSNAFQIDLLIELTTLGICQKSTFVLCLSSYRRHLWCFYWIGKKLSRVGSEIGDLVWSIPTRALK